MRYDDEKIKYRIKNIFIKRTHNIIIMLLAKMAKKSMRIISSEVPIGKYI